MKVNPYPRSRRNRPGFLLLMLLICVAIGAVIYLFALGPLVSRSGLGSRKRVRQADPNALPWEEEHYFVDDTLQGYGMEAEIRLYPEQPKLKGWTRLEATVYEGEEQRGTLEIRIHPDGIMRGSFSGEGGIGRDTLEARSFEGNVAPWKIYEDENGQDKSRLYLIGKGSFAVSMKDLETPGKKNFMEWFYVTGWIEKDYNAFGEFTVARPAHAVDPGTASREDICEIGYTTFEWEGQRVD